MILSFCAEVVHVCLGHLEIFFSKFPTWHLDFQQRNIYVPRVVLISIPVLRFDEGDGDDLGNQITDKFPFSSLSLGKTKRAF